MTRNVNAALTLRAQQAGTSLLLRHCLSLGTAEHRVPARTRLDEALGPDLARRLVGSLTARGRT
jgi:hypothetical protein